MEHQKRKVYVLADSGHDYSDAERFGELVYLYVPIFAKWDINLLKDTLSEGLKEATKDDLFIVSYLTSHCCVATALMVEWFGQVNLLMYRDDKYEEHNLVVNPDVES